MQPLYLTLLCLFGSHFLLANTSTSFSNNPQEFLDQMEQLVLPAKPKEAEKLMVELRKIFSNNQITDSEFEVMVKTNNLMAAKKLKANPYFLVYLEGVIELKKNENCKVHLTAWHQVLDGFLETPKGKSLRPLKVYLDFSARFFKDGTLRFSKSGTSWTSTLEDFKMIYANQTPQIYFEKTQLTAQSKKGKIQIVETTGTFFPLKNEWRGTGGKTFWKDHHFNLEEVYCTLGNYKLNTKKDSYTADSVHFFYPKVLANQSVLGKLNHKITPAKTKKPSTYPRFESYAHDLNLEDFIANATLTGGVKLIGTELRCFGNQETPAHWTQSNSAGAKHFELAAPEIILKNKQEIFAKKAATKVFFDDQFIFHPSAKIKYLALERILSLTAEADGRASGPFYDSFHQVHIYAPKIDVLLNEKEMIINQKKLRLGSKSQRVTFHSADVWNEKEYARIKAFSKVNPIILMAAISKKEGKRNFTVAEIATVLKFQDKSSALTPLFLDLMEKGFIIYFPDQKEVQILDKTFHYFDIVEEEKDYDQLLINSYSEKTNAVFDMKKKEIAIEGIKNLEFSRARRVAVEPLEHKMTLKENRAIDFSGNIYAGRTYIKGKKFHFDYEKFHIILDSIEHIEIFKRDEKNARRGKEEFTSLGSRIEGVSGILRIDNPENKSGKDTTEHFPKFESASSAYVYYDSKNLQEGQFGRDSFFFELDKFKFSDMNKIADDELKFKGRLYSHDIFPTIEALLEVQPDGQILGFQKQLPANGLPIFKKKGNFDGVISLDKNGLQGKGKVAFQTASFESDSINFLPTNLTCFTHRFDLKNRGGQHPLPLLQGDSATINWSPTQDSMTISTKSKAFKLFAKQSHQFEGDLVLTSDSLAGNGIMTWDMGILKSEEIRFSENGIQSDYADLTFKNKNETTIAINTKNVNASIHFDKKEGSFKSQEKVGTVDFPTNQYKTTLLDFDWDMGNETVAFLSDEGLFGKFTSTHTDKDSLDFLAKRGMVDLKSGLLHIEELKGISSADAWIEAGDGKLTIDKKGDILPLQGATIFAGEKNKFHVFNNAEVEIIGKKKFTGRGEYEYILDGQKQTIQNLEIEGDLFGKGKKAKLKTSADGEIAMEDNFFVKEKINFHGNVSMHSHSENVKFTGFARMQTTDKNKMHWFEMEHHSAKNDSTIAFTNPKNPEGETLRTGIFISKEHRTLYPKVMMPLLNKNDRPLFEAIGVLKIAEDENSFWLGDSTKVASPQNLGNVIQMPTDASKVVAIGKFNVDTFLNPIKLKMIGKAEMNFKENVATETADLKIRALAGLDMPLPKSLMRIILADIQASNFDAPSNIQKDRDFFLNILPEFLNKPQDLSKAFKNLTTNQVLILPAKKNQHTFLLSNLNLKWNSENQSFISSKNEIGLVSINGTPINNLLTGYFQLKLTSNESDRLSFYLVSPSGSFYYFGYKNGVLETYSNFEKYNEEVEGLKKKEREIKLENGELFELILGEANAARNFLNRIQYMQKH